MGSFLRDLFSFPISWAVLAFIVAINGIGFFAGPTTCADGWASPSIGRQGACSHHGGVDGSAGLWGLIGGGVAALAAYKLAARGRRHIGIEPAVSAEIVQGAPPTELKPLAPPSPAAEPDDFVWPPRPVRREPKAKRKSTSGIVCPECGAGMVRRKATRGRRRGRMFYGCETFPVCRGARNA